MPGPKAPAARLFARVGRLFCRVRFNVAPQGAQGPGAAAAAAPAARAAGGPAPRRLPELNGVAVGDEAGGRRGCREVEGGVGAAYGAAAAARGAAVGAQQ